jgi:hypothetical protein
VLHILKSQVIRYIEFSSNLILQFQYKFVSQWKDGDHHLANRAVCTNYITVTLIIIKKIFIGQWVNPNDP